MLYRAELLSPAKVKEKALMALSVRKLVERGWLTALLGYLIKREEVEVRLKYIGDLRLQRKDFGALAITTYYASKCWPKLPEDLAKTSHLLKPQQEALPLLITSLSIASYACKQQSLGYKASVKVGPEKVSLEVNGVSVAFNPSCVNVDSIIEIFTAGEYEVPEMLSGLKGRDVIDVGASVGDTALYFVVLNGARKVIAVEPLPNVAKCAEENLKLSGATDKVKVINAALSNELVSVPCNYDLPNVAKCAEEHLKLNGVTDEVKVINAALGSGPVSVPCDYDLWSSNSFSTLSASGPCKVPGVTLGDPLNMVDDPYLLKMDCEGCEAEAMLGPERERLRSRG